MSERFKAVTLMRLMTSSIALPSGVVFLRFSTALRGVSTSSTTFISLLCMDFC